MRLSRNHHIGDQRNLDEQTTRIYLGKTYELLPSFLTVILPVIKLFNVVDLNNIKKLSSTPNGEDGIIRK